MDILKYNGYTEAEIYNLIKKVRTNDYKALEKLNLIFRNKIYIKSNSNYDNELTSFFHELLLKIPLDNLIQNHKLINYILSSLKKKKAKIFKTKINSPVQLNECISLTPILTTTIFHNSFHDLINLKKSLLTLSLNERLLLSLYYKYGYTEEEIGNYFGGISKSAISKRKKKILKKLQKNF